MKHGKLKFPNKSMSRFASVILDWNTYSTIPHISKMFKLEAPGHRQKGLSWLRLGKLYIRKE